MQGEQTNPQGLQGQAKQTNPQGLQGQRQQAKQTNNQQIKPAQVVDESCFVPHGKTSTKFKSRKFDGEENSKTIDEQGLVPYVVGVILSAYGDAERARSPLTTATITSDSIKFDRPAPDVGTVPIELSFATVIGTLNDFFVTNNITEPNAMVPYQLAVAQYIDARICHAMLTELDSEFLQKCINSDLNGSPPGAVKMIRLMYESMIGRYEAELPPHASVSGGNSWFKLPSFGSFGKKTPQAAPPLPSKQPQQLQPQEKTITAPQRPLPSQQTSKQSQQTPSQQSKQPQQQPNNAAAHVQTNTSPLGEPSGKPQANAATSTQVGNAGHTPSLVAAASAAAASAASAAVSETEQKIARLTVDLKQHIDNMNEILDINQNKPPQNNKPINRPQNKQTTKQNSQTTQQTNQS